MATGQAEIVYYEEESSTGGETIEVRPIIGSACILVTVA